MPPELLDKNYNSYESMISEASYLALMSGYIPSDLEKDQLSSSFINYNHTVYDEFYFLKKFFNPIWSVAFLIYRLITFGYFYSAISAFFKTLHVKRTDSKYGFLILEKIKPDKFYRLNNIKKPIRIIIPTYNRYKSLFNLLKDLEKQTYSNFRVSIVDQSEEYNYKFYNDFNLQIDLQRQTVPGLWKARNSAIKKTSERIIAFLDDDSRVGKNWLFNHLKCLEYYKLDISAGISISKIGAKIPSNYYFYRVSDQIDTGNVILKREIFDKCGLFDEKFEGMRMGDAEFGLRTFTRGIISVSNPEAHRLHLKISKGGLRQVGSWDTFRPTSFLKPRPIPSALYYARKYFGDRSSIIFLIINLPLSLSTYTKKDKYFYSILSLFLFIILFPILLTQVLISWKKSSNMLITGNEIPGEK